MTDFRPMRRVRQMLPESEAIEILKTSTAGTLALLGDGGYPYSLPISYVYADGKLYFHSALQGHKLDAIRSCDKASFSVIERDDVQPKKFTTYFRSVICFGRIHVITNPAEKERTCRLLGERYNPGDAEGLKQEMAKAFSHMCMIELDIEHLTGKEAIELVRARRQAQP